MSDEAALLRAIYAEPDEDTPRLVYADWLDENGRPERAEFIRLQLELSHLTDEDPRERPLRDRRWELWEAHHEQWTAEIGIVESKSVKVEFRRGFIDELNIHADIPGAVDLVCRVPGVRRVSLWRVTLTPDAVCKLATLDLDSLTIFETSFPIEWLELLEPLPCGTVLDITPKDAPFDRDVWHDFQTRRIGRLTQLTSEERYSEARRWHRGSIDRSKYNLDLEAVGKAVCLEDVRACDVEMSLLTELTELEEIRIDDCDLTVTGVEYIAKLPNLKRLDLSWVRVESLAPLTRCITLEYLRFWPESGYVVTDEKTEGLEHLVNLRKLLLRYEYGELTLARLGTLRKLKSLDIELRDIENANLFSPLSNLKAMEQLDISGNVPGGALRFLAPCHKLQTMNLCVPIGVAEDFAALGALYNLRELHIKGEGVTDAAIQHLAPLTKLHRLMAQGTEVTPAGARWLADQLPDITVILDDYVAKSRREAITFCRRVAKQEDAVSAQLPVSWKYSWGMTTAEPARALIEDGWGERHGYGGSVGPALIRLYSTEGSDPAAALNEVTRCSNPAIQAESTIQPFDITALPGSASCVHSIADERHLVTVLADENHCAVLECYAPASRFEEFRTLFLFIARSLRIGPAALEGVGEEITVPVSEL